MAQETYWVETLGCPKNEVDSAKLIGKLEADGYAPATSAEDADVVVVNTCAFIDAARQESVDTVIQLGEAKRSDAKLIVTGLAAGLAVGMGALVYFVSFRNWTATLIVAWLTMAGSALALVPLVTLAFNQYDVARDSPP